METIAAMRAHLGLTKAIRKLTTLCDEVELGHRTRGDDGRRCAAAHLM
jgi:hypothetical protein